MGFGVAGDAYRKHGMSEMDAIDELPVFPTRRYATRPVLVLRFAILSSCVFLLSALLTSSLLAWLPAMGAVFGVPIVFGVATVWLLGGALTQTLALKRVRREKQAALRRWLVVSIGLASVFNAFQSVGLASIMPATDTTILAQTGSVPFAIGVVVMHGLHMIVAEMFLCWITVQAFNERYDHEYYKPLWMCVGFWNFLSVIWLSLLVAIGIAL